MNKDIKSKKYVLRFNIKNLDTFRDIKSGKKKVETRAATERYNKIQKGDILVLVCGKERIEKEIIEAKHFKNLPGLLKTYSIGLIMPGRAKTLKEAQKIYFSYPGYEEKIKKFGLMAFKLK